MVIRKDCKFEKNEMNQWIKSYWNTLGPYGESSLTEDILFSKIHTGVRVLSEVGGLPLALETKINYPFLIAT